MQTHSARIAIIDDDRFICRMLSTSLRALGFATDEAGDGLSGLDLIRRGEPDLVLLDLTLPELDGFSVLDLVHAERPELPIIIVTADDKIDSAVEAIRRGAFHYVPKPVDTRALEVTIQRALEATELARRVRRLEDQLDGGGPFGRIIGASPALREAVAMAQRVARTDATVLVTGESGTGKDLLAEGIHRASGRSAGPYVTMNCAALPAGLLENELFGHYRGAFTDAAEDRPGKFELASGGTILLDEIGVMDLDLQPKILRVLESREVQRLGGAAPVAIDVRIVASTNSDLEGAVQAGRFRADLFYRLNVVRIIMPPLRDRPEDIPTLATYFLRRAAKRYESACAALAEDVADCLTAYHWPGNVRELENIMERLVILASGPTVSVGDLPPEIRATAPEAPRKPAQADEPLTLDEVERRHILAALERNGFNQSQTARELGLKRGTLISRMQKLGIPSRL